MHEERWCNEVVHVMMIFNQMARDIMTQEQM